MEYGFEDLNEVVEKVGDSASIGLDIVNLLGEFYAVFTDRNVTMTIGKIEMVAFEAIAHAIPVLEQIPSLIYEALPIANQLPGYVTPQ